MNGLVGLAAGSAALAVLLVRPPPGTGARRRLARLTKPGPGGRAARARAAPTPRALAGPRARWITAGFGATALFLVVGGWLGVLLATGATVAVARALARRQPGEQWRRDEQLRRDLPAGLDLLAACLQAGTPTAVALDAVGAAMGGPLEAVWRAVASAVRLGGDLDAVRPGGPNRPPRWPRPAGRFCAPPRRALPWPSWSPGSPPNTSPPAGPAGEVAVRCTAVFVLLPLGLCFLPAFVLVGVVPVVTAVARAALP